MNISLSSLSQEQLLYLKQKWSAEIRELDLDHVRASERLSARLERRANNAEELDALEERLTKAKGLLTHLQTSSAPQEFVDSQQAVVSDLQAAFDAESAGAGVLTDEEAILQEVAIDEIALRKTHRESKIADIDALLSS